MIKSPCIGCNNEFKDKMECLRKCKHIENLQIKDSKSESLKVSGDMPDHGLSTQDRRI